jgi:hypothetical protein
MFSEKLFLRSWYFIIWQGMCLKTVTEYFQKHFYTVNLMWMVLRFSLPTFTCSCNCTCSQAGVFKCLCLCVCMHIKWSQDISVSIVTRLWAGQPRSRGAIPGRGKRFSLLYNFQTGPGAHLASHTMGTGGCFMGIKRQMCEADHTLPFSAGVKNGGAIPPLLHTSSWCCA